jgi:hypothetical protein
MANNRYRKKRRPESNYVPPFAEQILNQPLSDLSFRAENTQSLLEGAGIKTIGDVLKREEKDFYKIHTFKKRNLLDVLGAVRAKKLFLKPAEKPPEKAEEKPETKTEKPQQRSTRQTQQDRRRGRGKDKDNRNKDKDAQKRQTPPEPQDIYIKVNKSGKWGFSDRSGKIVIEPIYDEVFYFKEDLCCVEKDELFGFINRQGEEVIPIIYECALSFSEGLACVYKGGKCGYINAQNEMVIDFKFDAGTSFIEGSSRVKRDGKWGELRLESPNEIRWIN